MGARQDSQTLLKLTMPEGGEEKFEDIKGGIISRNSKNRHTNDHKNKWEEEKQRSTRHYIEN